jgi:hypothetical protein
LLIKLTEHVDCFNGGGSGRLGAGMLSFLNFWLSPHINGHDRQHIRRAPPRLAARELAEETVRTVLADARERP